MINRLANYNLENLACFSLDFEVRPLASLKGATVVSGFEMAC